MEGNQENKNPVETNYLEAIKNLKENSVPKEDYERVVNENKTLLEGIVNGGALPTNQKVEENTRTVEDIRKELYGPESGDLSNLKTVELTLELRDKIIEEGGEDPFLPIGKDIIIQQSDRESAQRVADALKSCVESANGDEAIFRNELTRVLRG